MQFLIATMKSLRNTATLAIVILSLSGCNILGHSAKSPSKPERPIVTDVHEIDNSSPEAFMASIDGEWIITHAIDKDIVQDNDRPYVYFDVSAGAFYASNGCNVLNGMFNVGEDNTITFSNVLATMKACPDIKYQNDINSVLRDGVTVHTKVSTNEIQLTTASGAILMTLYRHPLDFLNGEWYVTKIGSENVDDEGANIFFDIDGQRIHGNTGCNYFNGTIEIDPRYSSSVMFSQMGVTRMACPDSSRETKMLVALEETTSIVKGKRDTAELRDSAGNTVMVIRRAEK